MDYNKLKREIDRSIRKNPADFAAYDDQFSLLREYEQKNFKKSHAWNHELREKIRRELKALAMKGEFDLAEEFDGLLFRSLAYGAPHYFDDFLQAIEYGKPVSKQFYLPRRHYLKRFVDAYQRVKDRELDFLSISMPKRCGKSQTGILFTMFLSGSSPNGSTLMEGTGDDLVNSFYKGCLEYVQQPNNYHFYDIFPESVLVQTNADMKTINLVEKSRFPTIMCRSIDSRQVGLSEATNLLYLDDCVEGREEAKNRDRLDQKWEVLSGDVIGRALEGTPIVICGTRYSLYDPIGRLQEEMTKQEKRMEILEIPALDPETDKSNFEYTKEGRKQFSTQYFRDQRSMLTEEQWASEFQQEPFEAKGLMFPKGDLNYYFELPVDMEPDARICVGDTAEDGEDFLSMPIAYIYGDEVYIVDVVYDDSPSRITMPQCVKKIIEHKVVSGTFESNNAGTYFARDVSAELSRQGYMCNITSKRTISNKNTRIEYASVNIIRHFYFLHPSKYKKGSQYDLFMKNITTYTRSGKVSHDDGPDSISLLENELRKIGGAKVEIFKRPF